MRVFSFRLDILFAFYIFEKKLNCFYIFLIYRKLGEPPGSQVSTMSLKDVNGGVPLLATELNPRVNKFSVRWDYFLEDCVWSGIESDGSTRDIKLVSEGCVNKDFNVLLASKYGTKKSGHVMLFESISFRDGHDHYLSCDIKVCLKSRFGKTTEIPKMQ